VACPMEQVRQGVPEFESIISDLLSAPAVPLGSADPPSEPGIYALVHEGKIKYVGEAIGSKGLRDRLLSKHVSGDDSHTLQRVFAGEYPDRILRREHIKVHVHAKWRCVPDRPTASVVERLLIWAMRPEWNIK
jgi:hypothetical protein